MLIAWLRNEKKLLRTTYFGGEGSTNVVPHDVHPEESSQIGPVSESAEESAQSADGSAADTSQEDGLRHEEGARQW